MGHISTLCIMTLEKTDHIFMKILTRMRLWTIKSPSNFASHPNQEFADPDFGSGPDSP